MNRADILRVAAAYASRDSWGIEGVYLGTLGRLLAMLDAGIPPEPIIEHAGHVGRDCCPLAALDNE